MKVLCVGYPLEELQMVFLSPELMIIAPSRSGLLSAIFGKDGMAMAKREFPDAVVIGYGIPDMDTPEDAVRQFREILPAAIILTAGVSGKDGEVSLYDPRLDICMHASLKDQDALVKKLQALFSNYVPPASQDEQTLLQCGSLCLNISNRILGNDGKEVALTGNEVALLQPLMQSPNKIVSYEDIAIRLQESGYAGSYGAITVVVSSVRHKLGKIGVDPRILIAERGQGYVLGAEEST